MKNKTIQLVIHTMKLSVYVFLIQVLALNLLIANDTKGQKTISVKQAVVSVNMKNASLSGAFKHLESISDYHFNYKGVDINKHKKLDLKFENALFSDVLLQISRKYKLGFRQLNDVIQVVKFSDMEDGDISEISMADVDITGKITDENGEGLPGASVVVKGTTVGTTTDLDGNYKVSVAEQSILTISFVGYKTQEITIGNQSVIDVQMAVDAEQLEEVVVIGYGSVQKKDLTGSVASVGSESIERINTPSLNDALQGMAAGVQVTSSTGRPGEASSVLIRGGSSISASNEPLYVIDGFPQLGGSNLDLNPQNIASIDILKDASAGAIYGARASNGVVIITTKSGSRGGKLNISYTGRRSFSSIIKELETIDIVDYAKIHQVRAPLDEQPLYANPEQWADSTSIDWQDEIYRTAAMQMHDLQITGGSNNTKYSASIGYLTQEGIAIGSDYSRLNSRLRIETDLNNKLIAGVNISYATDERNGPSLNGEESAGVFILKARPYIPGGPFPGDLVDYVDPDVGTGQTATNPSRWLTGNDALRNQLTFRTINYLDFKPFKGFSLRASGSMSYNGTKNRSYLPSDVGIGRNYNGIANISHNQTTSWLYENTAKYKFTVSNHEIETLIGFSAQSTIGESFGVKSQNFPIENLGYDNIGLGVDVFNPSSNKYKSTMASYFGRVNYTYRGRYLLTASVRYDGSSNLGEANKWGAFPSVALAWRASEEHFIQNLNVFSDLKFRISYGITGNNSIGNYRSLGTYSSANVSINSAQVLGLRPGSMSNVDLKWEQNRQLDLGFDIGVFGGRLNITADYYKKKSNDLLLNAPIPINSGFTSFTSNIGDIESSGYELDIRGVVLNGKVKWTSQFNISFPSTKVLRLSETDYFFTGSWGHKSSVFIVKEGEALGSIYGYVYDGVNQNEDEVTNLPQFGGAGAVGGPRYKDISGPDGVPDGVIDSEYDREIIGNGLPDAFGGLTNKLEYKNFDLSFVFSFRYGNEVLNANKNFLWRPNYRSGGLKKIMDAWTPENPTNENWAWDQDGIEYNNVSSWLVEDGSFIRLRNITLGYTLPSILTKTIGIERCRFFVSGDKLMTFTNYSGYDPEVSVSSSMLTPGVDLTNYPNQKSVTLGVNVTF
ncbi:TonB-dependent receptor [Reichenbachiella sp. MALMAid0571]|uniref:SusC/RagA family TonB-linked outer membrane protein n=1 Tax=Reichenbachiella sp. MALMAid0571 TaxID=3143939 RepID=UPI0032DEC7EA